MSLNKPGKGKLREKSRMLRITLPRTNPNIKSDIDAILNDGWHIATSCSFVDGGDTQILYTFTKPKRN